MKPHSLFNSLRDLNGLKYYSLPALEEAGLGQIERLPVSIRVVLESVLRNADGKRAREEDVRALAAWQPRAERTEEIPFVVARVLLQDFTGVPLLVDLAAMRSALAERGGDPKQVEPLVPVELVVDHSVQVDYFGSADALQRNMEIEFSRNRSRYEFLKWGTGAFNGFAVVPPGVGIVHQVNLERLARGVMTHDGIVYPDTLVGTDSHTTMVNGLGVLGWGVGGIEAEAGMLGQPVYFLTPDVVGMELTGTLRPGVTATDLVLHITQVLRKYKVVGKFVEFFGAGAASLSVADRATISNMAPEYGATAGFFPPDENCCKYLTMTGRTADQVDLFRKYYQAQGMWGMPGTGQIDYTDVLSVNLADVVPCAAGPKRPQDRIPLADMKDAFRDLMRKPKTEGGYGIANWVAPLTSPRNTNPETELEMIQNRPTPDPVVGTQRPAGDLGHGDVVIAAITSCTNTSNPSVMLGAGILAKKAVERGLKVPAFVKTSLAPGSRVVSDYLTKTGLQKPLDALGFQIVGYGCTTCIGNSGPLPPAIEDAIKGKDLVVASVLSGNRNFEARVHQSVRANYLMSPPLVVAYALAGTVDIDMDKDPLGTDKTGKPVFLKDIWPSPREIEQALATANDAESYRRNYRDVQSINPMWSKIPTSGGVLYQWDPKSDYVRNPPYFEGVQSQPPAPRAIKNARALAIFGDSITTDHISPAGAIKADSPAGKYLAGLGIAREDFNTYGARRGNHEVMVRGTFANVRIKNQMMGGQEGGLTKHQPSGETMAIYDAAEFYRREGTPLVVFAGTEYGTGSSRDWAAKGTLLLGVRAVIAQSFERIHRSNLVGMGVLPLQFEEGITAASLTLDGTETFDLAGTEAAVTSDSKIFLRVKRKSGETFEVPLHVRIDTPIEAEYYRHGGILPYMLRQILAGR